MTEEALRTAEAALQMSDPILGALIRTQSIELPTPRTNYFSSLTRSIIGQQVSVAAARAIATRFEDKTGFEPSRAADLTEEDIKTIGLSRQKASYIHDLALHFVHDPEIYNHLETQSDDDVIRELTAVKGIGVWTAQMFLMFTLIRPDIFAPDDGGLQRGMMQLYGWDILPPKKVVVAAAEIWKPYRTVASLHLWTSLDNKPS